MTPESGVLLALVIVISVCGIFTTCVCCMCCCVASVWNAFVDKLFGRNGPIFGNKMYQSVPPTRPYGYNGESNVSNSAVYAGTASYVQQPEDIPMVEAYVVPPLAAQRSNSDANSLVRGVVEEDGHGTSSNISSRPAVTSDAKDVWAAIVFVINVIIIFSLAIQSVVTFDAFSSSSSEEHFDLGNTGINFPMLAFYLTLTLFLISGAGSYLVYFFLDHGENIIDWVMRMNIAGLFLLAVLSLIALNIFGSIFFGIMGGINLWYYYSVRNRIPFASSVLSAACTAVKANFTGLLLTSFAGLMFQGLWMMLWAIALFGVYTRLSTENDSTSTTTTSNNSSTDDNADGDASGVASFVSILMLFSLYWGLQLIKDVVAVTAGGTVATWWFQPKHPAPVRGSLFRSTTTSFGSICFGSMVVAVITTLRVVVKSILDKTRRRRGRGNNGQNFLQTCLLVVLESLLRCLENLLKYINKYAYSYVAAYGYDFMTAGRSVLQLFDQRGWAAIINDDLISNALFLFAMFMAVIGVLVGLFLTAVLLTFNSEILAGMVTDASSVSSVFVLGGVYGGLVGLVVGLLVVGILDSAVAMVYVCFAEDSNALQLHHPDTFRDLSTKWSLFQAPMSSLADNDEDEQSYYTSSTVGDPYRSQNVPLSTLPAAGASTVYAPYHQPPPPPQPPVVEAYHEGGPMPHYSAPVTVYDATDKYAVAEHNSYNYFNPTQYSNNQQQQQGYYATPPVVQQQHVAYHSTAAAMAPSAATGAPARPPPVNPNFQPGGHQYTRNK